MSAKLFLLLVLWPKSSLNSNKSIFGKISFIQQKYGQCCYRCCLLTVDFSVWQSALGPLRVNSAAVNAGALAEGAKLVIITSQAGSCEWRTTQNANEGGDYGHHMSRAACNIAGVLQAEELRGKGYSVILLHPGFNRTEMTAKYKEIWDVEGAVEPKIGAKRVLYEAIKSSLETTGQSISMGLRSERKYTSITMA